MKHRKRLTAALVVIAALTITAGVAYAAGVGSVNNGTNSAADGDYSTVGGGLNNSATGFASVVAGGGGKLSGLTEGNIASGTHSTVSGGRMNTAAGDYSVVAGGLENSANGFESAVLGGGSNLASGGASAVLSGHENAAMGSRSLVAGGSGARAVHDDSFVWFADSERDGEFVVRAYGGVRFIVGGGRTDRDGEMEIDLLEMAHYIESLEARIEALENGDSPTPQPIQPEPSPTPPGRDSGPSEWRVEAENMHPVWPLIIGADDDASGERYIFAQSGNSTTTPSIEASYDFSVPAIGEYWLWARLWAANDASDAIYVGIDGSFDRVYPDQKNAYRWVRVGPQRNRTGKYGVTLDAGQHEIQVGHAETGARLDALYVTDDWDARP